MAPRAFSSSTVLLAIVCAALLGSVAGADAQRPQPVNESKSLHETANIFDGPWGLIPYPNLADGPVVIKTGTGGVTETSGTVTIRNTATTPIFYPVHGGSAELVAVLRNGHVAGSIEVSVVGEQMGIYTVSAVTVSSSSTVLLGTMTVTSGTTPLANENNNNLIVPEVFLSAGSARFGRGGTPFPVGFNPFDVATILLSGSNGGAVYSATLTPVPATIPQSYLTALSPVAPAGGARQAWGYALLHAVTPPVLFTFGANLGEPLTAGSIQFASDVPSIIVLSGSGILPILPFPTNPGPPPRTGRIVIRAHGLPPKTQVFYAVGGADLGKATTDAAGNLNVYAGQGGTGKLPLALDLFSVKELTVHDAGGTVLLNVQF